MAEAFYNFEEDDASSNAEDSEWEEVELVEELDGTSIQKIQDTPSHQ